MFKILCNNSIHKNTKYIIIVSYILHKGYARKSNSILVVNIASKWTCVTSTYVVQHKIVGIMLLIFNFYCLLKINFFSIM